MPKFARCIHAALTGPDPQRYPQYKSETTADVCYRGFRASSEDLLQKLVFETHIARNLPQLELRSHMRDIPGSTPRASKQAAFL